MLNLPCASAGLTQSPSSREEKTPSKRKKKEKKRVVPLRPFRTAEDHDADMLSFRFKGGKQEHDGVLIKHGVPSRPHVQVADQVR
jgi:hypothetical protein